MFGLGEFFGAQARFSFELKCYSVSVVGRSDLETGSRLVLPPEVLQRLQRANVPSPMHFEVSDLEGTHRTHAGVLEFVAEEETCYMPDWMLRHLRAEEGHVLRLCLKQLQKATFARFQPATVALLRIYNPKVMLEKGLRDYVALTIGDVFPVPYDGQTYEVEVLEVRPGDAVSIIDTDVEVEFATPKDAEAAAAAVAPSPVVQTPASATSDGVGSTPQTPATGGLRALLGMGVPPPSGPDRPLAWHSAGTTGTARSVSDSADEDDPMPWKKRIPKGVKWTSAPYGCDTLRMVGAASSFGEPLRPSFIVNEALRSGAPANINSRGTSSSALCPAADSSAARALALEAAETRYALNAKEIEQRRREEEEAKERQRMSEEQERQRQAAAEEVRKRKGPAQSAPEQKQMCSKDRSASPPPPPHPSHRSGGRLCCCFRTSGKPDEPNARL